jgi:porin
MLGNTSPQAAKRRACFGAFLFAALIAIPLAAAPAHAQSSPPSQPESVNAAVSLQPPVPAPDACAKLDSWSLRPTWNIPYISTSQTLYPDCSGLRGALAQDGIGIGFNNIENGALNFLSLNAKRPDGQQYVGQKPTGFSLSVLYLTFDLDTLLGIPNAKLVTGVKLMEPTWATIGPNYFGLNSLYYDQLLFHDHVEVQIGYIENDFEYIGTYVGGKFAGGTLGPQATIPYEVGLSNNVSTAPAINLRASLGDFYDKVGVQRSIPPGGNVRFVALNRLGANFNVPGTKALVIDELGYQVHPAPGAPAMWLRGGGIYNFTRFPGFGTDRTSTNDALYALADFQLLQTFHRPESGIFLGGSIMYAPPGVNMYSQYYELRLYDVGPFVARPYDLASLVATRTAFSKSAIDYYEKIGVPAHNASTGLTASYTFRVIKGLWLGAGLTYTHNPAFRVQPGDPNALSGTLALTIWG